MGVEPTTADNALSGLTGRMNAALGVRFLADFFAAFFAVLFTDFLALFLADFFAAFFFLAAIARLPVGDVRTLPASKSAKLPRQTVYDRREFTIGECRFSL